VPDIILILNTSTYNTIELRSPVTGFYSIRWILPVIDDGADFLFDDIELIKLICDTDNDGIPNIVDLDSDNDGCPDFIEGGGSFTEANQQPAGGTLNDGNGGTVTTNLGNIININQSGSSYGVPVVANNGQTIGSSHDAAVQSAGCPGFCLVETSTPNLSSTNLSNTCPATTVNLNDLVTNTPPAGADLRWYDNNNDPPTGTPIANPTIFSTAGTYYAFFYDGIGDCFGPASEAVTVIITTCDPCDSQGGDTDNDGVCDDVDCQPNDPAFPAAPGSSCDDGNPNTQNDVVQSDGCTCQGFGPCTTNVLFVEQTYLDNNTPNDLTDDTFTFTVQVLGSGTGWTGGGQSGNYGDTVTFGPYPVDRTDTVFSITDMDNPNCYVSLGVGMDSCIYTGACKCCD